MYDYTAGSEQDLIRRAKNGDTKAFSQLYAAIYKDLYRFALYATRNSHDAEDAVSEAVIAAYENIMCLKKDNSFKSWFFVILSNRCKQILRSREKECRNIENEKIHEPDYAGNEDLRRALDELDDEERMIVAFSVFGGYKSNEIAGILKKNPSTIRSRKRRAFEKLRQLLA